MVAINNNLDKTDSGYGYVENYFKKHNSVQFSNVDKGGSFAYIGVLDA